MHMHLVETAYQKEYARRRGGGTALDHIDRFGFLGPSLTLGHGVWLNEADLDRVAATGAHICHNCSSNFRLRSGVAPLNAFEKRGINTAIGLDEAGINDDRDMLQEMRMVLRAHRVPGMEDEDVPSPGQVLRMATTGGAATTPYTSHIGTIAVGKAADLVLIDWDKLSYPYLDPESPVLTPSSSGQRATVSTSSWWRARSSMKEGISPGSTATQHCANCTHRCSVRSLTTKSSGGSCPRRSYPTFGVSTPAISIPRLTTPTTARAHEFEAYDSATDRLMRCDPAGVVTNPFPDLLARGSRVLKLPKTLDQLFRKSCRGKPYKFVVGSLMRQRRLAASRNDTTYRKSASSHTCSCCS